MKGSNAQTTPAHTALPWRLMNGNEICANNKQETLIAEVFDENEAEWKANAEFIVRACNSHYELLEHLRNIVEMARSVSANWENGNLAQSVRNLDRIATTADTALAKFSRRHDRTSDE